jgi:hypothetical protein
MNDASLIGTTRETAHVAAYRNDRIVVDGVALDGLPPDEVALIEFFREADGTLITDETRIAAIRAAQLAQGLEHPHE